ACKASHGKDVCRRRATRCSELLERCQFRPLQWRTVFVARIFSYTACRCAGRGGKGDDGGSGGSCHCRSGGDGGKHRLPPHATRRTGYPDTGEEPPCGGGIRQDGRTSPAALLEYPGVDARSSLCPDVPELERDRRW